MKNDLRYAVVYDDGSWAGLYASIHAAIKHLNAARRGERAEARRGLMRPVHAIGIFKVLKYTEMKSKPGGG